ncbi:hypothetical protein JCM17380_52780 [Desulfosporosinus burensis]
MQICTLLVIGEEERSPHSRFSSIKHSFVMVRQYKLNFTAGKGSYKDK